MSEGTMRRVAFVGNYLPRRCGIATFTTDLCTAVMCEAEDVECLAVAMNDTERGYAYPETVRFEISDQQRDQYDLAADYINISQVDAVCVQHEYGIYGGAEGRYLLPMLRQIRAPIVTTLHTVLAAPSPEQRTVMNELTAVSDRLVVMSPKAREFLADIYRVPPDKITLIHHGIPDMPFVDPNYYKDKLNAEGCRVLLTFGLLSPNKGIEYVIEALPHIVDNHPDVVCVVLGTTHPHIKRERGEEYRILLQKRTRELGIEKHVAFKNQYVELEELCEYLGAADIYITPYLHEAQIVSGTLAYAMGTGKACVSTPYWYAVDMLSDERGRLVPFQSAEGIAETVNDLLDNEAERHAMRKRAYRQGRGMIWREVARAYVKTFEEVMLRRALTPKPCSVLRSKANRVQNLPALDPRHLIELTDDVGILQHASFSVPDRDHGYSTDDQARALMVAVKAGRRFPDAADWGHLSAIYLGYLLYAFDRNTQRFMNFMDYARSWSRQVATEDVHARALWALSHVVQDAPDEGKRGLACRLLDEAVPAVSSFGSLRARAFALLAVDIYLRRYPGASLFLRQRRCLAEALAGEFRDKASADWVWPEDALTYANARVPHALIVAGKGLGDSEIVARGLDALHWLDRLQTGEDGHFVPVGNRGWFKRGAERARFDQQPIEAYTMIDACLAAYTATGEKLWVKSAQRAFDWFLGRNDLRQALYDYGTGGCHDGLGPDGVNLNQGAESTIVWLLSLLAMHELRDTNNETEANTLEGIDVKTEGGRCGKQGNEITSAPQATSAPRWTAEAAPKEPHPASR
ncbi:MAG: glycosyltransferase family 4 protein [Sedimentisphaerales bacterium]|nr:glycosyltransferase family 4 protein [Sedimentisphaerales bacterium]